MRRTKQRNALRGALAGIAATAAMTRIARDWVQIRHPDTELHYHPLTNLQWLVQKVGRRRPLPEHAAVPLAHALHYGYGALAGAAFAVSLDEAGRFPWALRGGAYGLFLWTVSFCGYVPLLGIYKPAWRFEAQEREVTLLAHGSYGIALAAVLEALRSGQDTRKTIT